jgi:hypothetical protein
VHPGALSGALKRTKSEYAAAMPPARLNPPQVLDRLLTRIEKRIDALKRVKLAGYEVAIAELEVEMNLLLRARRYLEQGRGSEHR